MLLIMVRDEWSQEMIVQRKILKRYYSSATDAYKIIIKKRTNTTNVHLIRCTFVDCPLISGSV